MVRSSIRSKPPDCRLLYSSDPSTSRPDGLNTAVRPVLPHCTIFEWNHQVNHYSGDEASTQLMIFYTLASNISFRPFSIKDTRVMQPAGQHLNIETTIRAPHEIYYEELLKHKRGLPLWFPGSSLDLPLTYRQNGTSLGDVGITQIDNPSTSSSTFFCLQMIRPMSTKACRTLSNHWHLIDVILLTSHATYQEARSEAQLYVNLFIPNYRRFCHICNLNTVLITSEEFKIRNIRC